MRQYTIIMMLLLIGRHGAFAQGFVNLDFEGANVSGYNQGMLVPATDAIPGWTAYVGGVAQTSIPYDGLDSRNLVFVSLGNDAPQGKYFIALEALFINSQPETTTAAIGQTGKIPTGTQSLIFWGGFAYDGGDPSANDFQVTFNGSPISFSAIGSAPDYTIYGADISEYAGDTGQLLFTASFIGSLSFARIDNIQFSPSPVPEPDVLSLLGMGGMGFLWHRRKVKAACRTC